MSKKLIALLSVISLISGCVNQNQKSSTTSSYDKIACTSVATCEVLEKLDIPSELVVGIPQSDNYSVPKRYQDATQLGTAMSPDMEVLKSTNANLILSPNSLESDLAQKYENLGIDSMFLNLKSTAGLYKSLEELGEILGKQEEASKAVEEFRSYMESYYKNKTSKSSLNVLILMGLPGSYVVATESSYVGSLVKLAGGENVYGDGDGQDFLNINAEDMVDKKPDIILRTAHALPEQVQQMFAEEFKENDVWKHFDAVKNNKVYDLDAEKFGMSATFTYQEALEDLGKILYEDAS